MNARRTRRRPLVGKSEYIRWDDLVAGPTSGVAGALWRWRAEIVLLISALFAWHAVTDAIGTAATVALLVAVLGLVFGIPWSRRWVIARAWCLITRHRLLIVFAEVRATTRTGRLPLIMRVKPSPVGERALVWCRAGISAEDLEARAHQFRSACYARDARVMRHARWSHLVTIDIVRRDPLAADRIIISHLVPVARETSRAAANGGERP